MKGINKLLLVTILVGLSCSYAGCVSPPLRGMSSEGKKVYMGPVPIQNTPAYQTYLLSSKSETAKLLYLGDRIKAEKNLTYWYLGSCYNWFEAYSAATWMFWQDHKMGEDARGFIRKEALRFQDPSKPATIEFPDRSTHIAFDILMNELDLLDETTKQKANPKDTPVAQPVPAKTKANLKFSLFR